MSAPAKAAPGAEAVRESGPPSQRWPVGSQGDPTLAKAALAYLALTIAATWPLALGIGRDVASDLGDPVLVMWILSWDCEQLLRILGGDLSRIATFFDGNIFHPAPLTLAYSDHLFAQAIQILPVWVISGNPILSYNLLFLSTFVLSGLGTFLLVRQLTGNSTAAFVAGCLFAFAPYRLPQSSHVQILSSQWMPFVLYGITHLRALRHHALCRTPAPSCAGGRSQCPRASESLVRLPPAVLPAFCCRIRVGGSGPAASLA
jgi:hypothetical protein